MSLKIIFCTRILNIFPENLRAVSDEHTERFQDIMQIEKCNQETLMECMKRKFFF